ncbi:MAG: SulP family inorganic anion transporter, partial [Geminicoccaceae bacterium]
MSNTVIFAMASRPSPGRTEISTIARPLERRQLARGDAHMHRGLVVWRPSEDFRWKKPAAEGMCDGPASNGEQDVMIGAARPTPPRFYELFTPKLLTVLREGYGAADLRADLTAGLTVAIVALPLSMAIGIASGVTPDRGLYAAIIGGFLISVLGGSRFQIG